MPRIPILPGDVSAARAAEDPFGPLPPAQADGIRTLRARDDGIARGLTVAEAWRDGVSALQQAEGAEDGAPAGFARDFLAISAGVRAAQIGTKGRTGASNVLASDTGPTGSSASKSKTTALRDLPKGPGFKVDRNFLTVDEFRVLPSEGRIDPQRIRTSQSGFDEMFSREVVPGVPESRRISFLVEGLKSGRVDPKTVPPIHLVEWQGQVYSVDRRRLISFRRVEVDVPYVKISFGDLSNTKQKLIRGASQRNDNGGFIRNEITDELE